MNSGLIVAAGKSERMGPRVDKAFLSLGTKPVLTYSLEAFEKCPDIDSVVLVVRKDRVNAAGAMARMFGCSKVIRIVAGGASRQVSVRNGLSVMGEDVRLVAVHDGARPCITPECISATVQSAKRYGSGVAACKITDTVKFVERGFNVSRTLDRSRLWAVQTPQTFKIELLREAYDNVSRKKLDVTDDAGALESVGGTVRLVPSTLPNIKITTPDDLALAAVLLKL